MYELIITEVSTETSDYDNKTITYPVTKVYRFEFDEKQDYIGLLCQLRDASLSGGQLQDAE